MPTETSETSEADAPDSRGEREHGEHEAREAAEAAEAAKAADGPDLEQQEKRAKREEQPRSRRGSRPRSYAPPQRASGGCTACGTIIPPSQIDPAKRANAKRLARTRSLALGGIRGRELPPHMRR